MSCPWTERLPKEKTAVLLTLEPEDADAMDALFTDARLSLADGVEWRLDADPSFLSQDAAARRAQIERGAALLGDKPLLLTMRTTREGGKAALAGEAYIACLKELIALPLDVCLDVEWKRAGLMARSLARAAHEAGKAVLFSVHDVNTTPSLMDLLALYEEMWADGGDVAKLAVMARSSADVLTALNAASIAGERHPEKELIALSMGAFGKISRVGTSLSTSHMTFACLDAPAAPGQMEIQTVRRLLDILEPSHSA
ncbi:MAG: type I 3-dehydroquinate dehydratase [Peptoniphilaceae bacterium]|nr:type I 3-dehydroquinate dehydratase [Peptoniphilaceae bacterium]MDY6086288.1 type I 3-dehydroquinate dehydratase [Peptoniphilaceae bacterium]